MCGRCNIDSLPLARWLLAELGVPWSAPTNPNAAPTETLTVLRRGAQGALEAAPMRWWLTPHWAAEPSTRYSLFNARAETLATSPAFRDAFRQRRCVLPVSGFYEWSAAPAAAAGAGRPVKVPWYLHADGSDGLLLAGVWSHWSDPQGATAFDSFAVVTTPAHASLGFVHHRQPVMLAPAEVERWLAADASRTMLAPFLEPGLPVALAIDPVSTRVNNARHKEPDCTTPIGPAVHLSATGDRTC